MTNPLPRAVLWDLDGSLVDSEPLHELTLVLTLESEGLVVPADLHARVVGRSARDIHALFAQSLGLAMRFEDWVTVRRRAYLARAGKLRPRPGAMDLFQAVQAAGLASFIVSNSDRAIVDANLDAIGLGAWRGRSVSHDDVERGKPDPAPYRLALTRLGCTPGSACVVEDSAVGAQAGLAAGCRTYFWPAADQAGPPDAMVVRDAQDLLRRLLGQDRGGEPG